MNNNWRFVLGWPFNFALAMLFRLLAPCFKEERDEGRYPWVIGGHRGRLYADNAGALHAYITQHTTQPIIWIAAYKSLAEQLRSQGHRVLMKNSWQARLALVRAPVLIYSHGEDDLDMAMRHFRHAVGLRVFLFHCMSHLKGGQWERGGMEHWSSRRLAKYAREMTDFDVLPTSSPSEKASLDRCFRDGVDRILPYGGGAHLDAMLKLREQETSRLLLWFPTFRDTPPEQQKLECMIAQVTGDERLHAWLEKQDFKLAVVRHINTRSALDSPAPHQRISFHGPSELLPLMGQAMAYISDYSGTILDWLCFGRPMVLFPFDQPTYLQSRKLLVPLEELQFGPLVHSAEALIGLLESGAWKDLEAWKERRDHWMHVIFPYLRPGFAQRCFETIQEVRGRFDEGNRASWRQSP